MKKKNDNNQVLLLLIIMINNNIDIDNDKWTTGLSIDERMVVLTYEQGIGNHLVVVNQLFLQNTKLQH